MGADLLLGAWLVSLVGVANLKASQAALEWVAVLNEVYIKDIPLLMMV